MNARSRLEASGLLDHGPPGRGAQRRKDVL